MLIFSRDIFCKKAWLGLALNDNNMTLIVFDLAISRDYILTEGHDILQVLNIKG
jgi:hypothetical protein